MAIERSRCTPARLPHLVDRTGRLINAGMDRLRLLVLRFGIASLPTDILLSFDDIVLTLLALRA